ncbi:transporter [Flavobacterium psychraquaticum]|uniref:transporter n=1 Tax=Flavobacterium psychraquaticum TaxID=3103958 RepID=UPI002ACEE03C|nr:transporter [Flavobacterium sp. LB-N7T]
MKVHSPLLLLIFIVCCQNSFGQFTDDVNSNRPGRSMMAFSVGKTVMQTETGVHYVSEDHNTLDYKASGVMAEFDFRWGLFFEQLELIAELQYQNDSYSSDLIDKNRSALKKTLLGAKYLVYDPFKNYEEKPNLYSWKANHSFKWRQLIPAVGVYAGVNLNFSDNPFNYAPVGIEESAISPKAMLIAQNHFGSRWVLVTNLSYNKIGTDFASIDYIITLTRGFNKQWSGFIENQGYNSDFYSDGLFRLGAAYLFNKDMQIDASVGKNIKNTPSIMTAGVGFSWRFTKNYKEVKIEIDKGSKMDKKVKKKAEKEEKKRKDAVGE